MKTIRLFFVTLLIVTFLLTATLTFVFNSNTGLHWLFQAAVKITPGKLQTTLLQGKFSEIIVFENLSYVDNDIEVIIKKASLQWRPLLMIQGKLNINHLHIDDIQITRAEENTTSTTTLVLPNIGLPLKLNLNDVHLKNVQLLSAGKTDLELSEVKLSAYSRSNVIVVSSLEVDTADYIVTLNGELTPQDSYPLDISGSFQLKKLFGEPLMVKADLSGNIQEIKTKATVTGLIHATVKGYIRDMLNDPSWDADVIVNQFSLNRISADLPKNNVSGKFHSSGFVGNITFNGAATTQYEAWGQARANFNLSLTDNQLLIHSLDISEDNHVALLDTQGSINWQGEEVLYALKGHWKKLTWPWNAKPVYRSSLGSFSYDGALSAYNLTLNADIEADGFPKTQLYAKTKGNLEKLQVNYFKLNAMDGVITGDALLGWRKLLQWKVNLDVQGLNPRFYAPQIQVKLNANISSEGKVDSEGIKASFNINKMNGELQGHNIEGSAKVLVHNDDINIDQFRFYTAGSTLDIQGDISDQFNLQFALRSDDLSLLMPQMAGSINAKGEITGPSNLPGIQMELEATQFKYQDYSVRTLKTTANLSLDPQHAMRLNLTAEDLQINRQIITRLIVRTSGNVAKHEIRLRVRQLHRAIDMNFSGGVHNDIWQGKIDDSLLHLDNFGDWRLKQSSELVVGREIFRQSQNCYVQKSAEICFQGKYELNDFNINLKFNDFPVSQFNSLLPKKIEISTLLNGNFDAKYALSQWVIDSHLNSSVGKLVFSVDEVRQEINFEAGEFNLKLDENQLTSNFLLPIEKKAKLSANVSIHKEIEASPLDQWPMVADVVINLPTLAFLSPFLHRVKNFEQSSSDVTLRIDGTLSQPQITGEARFIANKLDIPELNLSLKKIDVALNISEQRLLSISGGVESGNGKLEIDGTSKFDKQWQFSEAKVKIKGDEFAVVDLPEATVQISPELSIQFKNNDLSLTGDVTIPYARLRPTKLPESIVKASTDVVIVGLDEEPKTTRDGWKINSRIRLILGDRVSIDGFGLRSRLTGSMQIIDRPESVTTARGEINLTEGVYNSFGQELEISKGRFIFANSPIDDPGLDIKAQRNVDNIITGVHVTSTLKKPEVGLFSEPTMSEADILSYLLLGRPLQEVEENEEGAQLISAIAAMGLAGGELIARDIGNRLGIEEVSVKTDAKTGDSSLVIGSYLSPRLYIRYIAGISDRDSSFTQLRYNVSKSVTVQTETGSQMGADIFYSIDY